MIFSEIFNVYGDISDTDKWNLGCLCVSKRDINMNIH